MSSKLFLSFFFLTMLPKILLKISKSKVVVAVNCGGDEYMDRNGITYSEDKYFDTGVKSDHGINYEIIGTNDQDLYQTERWSNSDLTYSLPIKGDGSYVLILKFSEVFFNFPGEKVFNVALGKSTVIKDLDIFKIAGKLKAYDEYLKIEIKNGKVYHKENVMQGALIDEKLLVKFLKGRADNPKINAILLIKGTLADTDYDEQKKMNDVFNKKKLEEKRKHLTLSLRHNTDEIYEESQLFDENFEVDRVREDSIFSIFKTSLGLLTFGSVGLFLVLNFIIDLI